MRLVLVLFALAAAGQAATLSDRIDKILSEPAARRSFWGIQVVDLVSGRTLYQHNADRLFVPASTMKLLTTALALARLGPDHRFVTRLAAETPPDEEGRIAGDLALIGGGDPNLSARLLPFQERTAFASNRLQPLEDLAEQVALLGIRQIDGNIVGDDRAYVWERYGEGWTLEDTASASGAPVTALAFNDNTVTVRIRPGGKPGEPALVQMDPAGSYFSVQNRTRTLAPGASSRGIRIHRQPAERTVRLSGEIALGSAGQSVLLAVDDPALFAAQALREELLRRSVQVRGRALSRHAMPYEVDEVDKAVEAEPSYAFVLASGSSMPLAEILRVCNKASQNLHAEMLLRAVAASRRGQGSFPAALTEWKVFLGEAGVSAQAYSLHDGSGLSRLNLVTPAALGALLVWMWNSPHRQLWLDTLPVAGVDGTLRERFRNTPAAHRLRAKTGLLAHVRALAGYLDAPGRRLALVILANHFQDSPAARSLIDRLCLAMIEE